MAISAWTFLISRNQTIDYKTIVAPDFISQAKIRSLLLKVTDDDFTESKQIKIREVYGSEVGNFAVIFRSVTARRNDIGEEGNQVLKDSFGREIYWIEGLVFQKNQKELLQTIGEIHLDQSHQELQEKYREFWYEDKLSVSHRIDLIDNTFTAEKKLVKLTPFVIDPNPNLIEHQTQKIQLDRTYNSNTSARNKANLSKYLFLAIAALFIIGFLGIWQYLSAADICLYRTETIPIESEKPAEELVNLQDKHSTAWIWLKGDIKLESSEIDKIKKQVEDQGEKLTLNTTDDQILNMNNHPIDAAISLLQNKKIVSDKIEATIIEASDSNKNQCALPRVFNNR